MPRVSLPSTLKHLRSYEVLLTQTTESDLRSHYLKLYNQFELNKEKYKTRLMTVYNRFLDENPYLNKDWKKNIPSRHYKDFLYWFGEDDSEMQEYFNFTILCNDLKTLSKNLNWEELDEMLFQVESFIKFMATTQTDLEKIEEYRFQYAKKKVREDNKEWYEEQEEIKKHKQNHHTGYFLRIKAEDGESIEEDLKCKYCKHEYENEIINIQKVREYEAKQEQKREQSIENIPKEEVKYKPYVKPSQEICEDCGFKSHISDEFEYHKYETQHRKAINLKNWFCKECNCQSRTEIEYKNHCETTKHKKNIGELKRPEYVCEKCNYKTLLKHLYDQHCESKKHNENI
jgi:Asp-tRNA(Asn)/Glu-tRNA(Gln) amidotransferase C subunit